MIFLRFVYLLTYFTQGLYKKNKTFFILIAFCFLLACSASYEQARVSSRPPPLSRKVNYHVVAMGETLYSIAWRYGLDYKKLAEHNRIGRSYKIFPGQIIHLTLPKRPASQKRATVELPSTTPNISSPLRSNNRPIATGSVKRMASSAKPVKPVKKVDNKVDNKVTGARSKNKSLVKPSRSLVKAVPGKIYWRWPVRGKVSTNFNDKNELTRGIDIEGKKGDSVIAASSGQIVYAGNGLRAYGKLVIIKHNSTYLSAYAHNSRLLVKEGDLVNVGQHIADIGSTGVGINGKSRLHFQIRRNGKPIDPLPLLPKRQL